MPRSDYDKKPGDMSGKPNPWKKQGPKGPGYTPKNLKRRLDGDSWEKRGEHYQPPEGGTRMHRPGSQNPRK